MANNFQDLGIASELVAGTRDVGWDAPSALQKDAVPVLRRGNNAVLHASTGAGVTGAWGLALLDRVASFELGDDAPLALVLAPATDEASRTATTLARIGAPAGLAVRALAPGWTDRDAPILVGTPAAALAGVRDSSLKLDAVAILVISGADRIHALGGWDAVQTLTETMTGVAQKIVVTGEITRPIQEYLDGQVRKALTIPARPAEGETQDTSGSVRYAVATEDTRLEALVTLLPDAEAGEVAVVCRTQERAERVGIGLAARGIVVEGAAAAEGDAEPGGRRILVLPTTEADQRTTRASVISCDVPFDSDGLAALHRAGGTVLVTPAELPHLRRIAARAGLRLQARPLPHPAVVDVAEMARGAIRRALGEADLAAYLALLQPLLDEHPAPEVAAAALYLARDGGLRRSAEQPAGASAQTGGAATARSIESGAPAPSAAFVRLFISVGSRDGVTPGDLVGAITGEAEVPGETVGRIDIRESHSTVEVASTDADRVIRALNGRTLKGRSVRVDYDRKDRVSGPGGGRAPARTGSGGQAGRPGASRGGPKGSRGGRPAGPPKRGPRGGGGKGRGS